MDSSPFSNIKEQITDTYYNMDEPQKHYVKWKKADSNDYILYGFICMKYPEKANLWRQKANQLLPGGDRNALKLDLGDGSKTLYIKQKNHLIVHSEKIHGIESRLNKTVNCLLKSFKFYRYFMAKVWIAFPLNPPKLNHI